MTDAEPERVMVCVDKVVLLTLLKMARECAEDLLAEVDAKYSSRDDNAGQHRRWARDRETAADLLEVISDLEIKHA